MTNSRSGSPGASGPRIPPLTQQERNDLLTRYHHAYKAYDLAMGEEQYVLADALMDEAAREKTEYFARLPRPVLGCCPFDGRPLERSFDPYGLDGLWWYPDATPKDPPSCPHFCMLVGAVNYHGEPPRAGAVEIQPGPEVPYVIPRILELPGMIAVIGELEMAPGFTAYPIAYFAERRPPPEELNAGWARKTYTYQTQRGVTGWTVPNDVWDFNLLPWLRNGKLRWCEPGSGNRKLSAAPPDQCPYLGLLGERQRVVVRGKNSWVAGLPDGEPIQPIDR